MWDFDWDGDLYFEKTVQFLKDLFKMWRDDKAKHQITIIFFSRTLYDNGSIHDHRQLPHHHQN